MVDAKIFLSLGVIAGIGVLGYAVYRNLDKIGGAFARGTTQSIIDPFGNFFENLFSSSNGGTNGNGTGPSSIAGETVNGVTIPADTTVQKDKTVTSSTPPTAVIPGAAAAKSQTQKVSDYLTNLFGAFSASAQLQLLQEGAKVPTKTQFPAKEGLTNVINLALKSVGGTDPKLYQLKTLGGKVWAGTVPQPLSKQAVSFYATKGIIAHQIYL